jgi:tetratricopeptide (TPR) repeat protein
VTGRELDRQVRGELGTLSKENATQVARHLVMTFQLLDDDPQAALQHALAAQRRAGRVGLVREAAGLAAYRAGEYEQALRELRTARRLTGTQEHLPVMADCERGLGRPERALALAAGAEARQLDRAGQLELLIVAAGARQDLGQHDAAVVMLQVPELTTPSGAAHARLLSAYADALDAAGRRGEALLWLERAAAADVTGETGAAERLGIGDLDDDITDLLDDDNPETPESAGGLGHHAAHENEDTVEKAEPPETGSGHAEPLLFSDGAEAARETFPGEREQPVDEARG